MFRYARFFLISIFLVQSNLQGVMLAFDLIRPYDRYLWTYAPKEKGAWQCDVYGASSFNERGVRWDHTKICNILQIWQCDQNALAMVQGFDPGSAIGQVAAELNGVTDDGVRGHLIPTAQIHMAEFGFSGKYWLSHGFSLGLFLPFVRMQLKNVQWCECTQEKTEEDLLTKELLTTNLAQNVCTLGGLDICSGWRRTGLGDISTVLRWEQNFSQSKPILTDVLLSLYLGLSFPTGKKQDEDKLFAVPFGYDGSPGILFGGSLNLVWKHHFYGGVELNFTQLIGDTRLRRIKTACDQTELLLLAKTQAHIDWGFLQRYRLYLGAHNIVRGLSFDVNYQFQKQGDSSFSLCNDDYVGTIANSAESLKQWTLHQVGFDLSYDFGYDFSEDIKLTPTMMFFYRKAFKGRRTLLMDKWGFSFVFSF